MQKESLDPTKGELEILRVLWLHGPSTVRFVNDCLKQNREVNYTTTLKQMQLMHEKGMLHRDDSQMKHIYYPAEEEKKTKARLLNLFVENLYNGSPVSLLTELLGNRRSSEKEMAEIKDILRKIDLQT